MRHSVKLSNLLYYIGLFLAALSSVVITSSYLITINGANSIVRYSALVMLLLSILASKWNSKDFIKIITLVGVAILVTVVTGEKMVVLYLLLIFALNNKDYKDVYSYLLKINILFVVLIVGSCALGIIPNEVFSHGDLKAYSFGFYYYNSLSYFALFLTILGYSLIDDNAKKTTKEVVYIIASIFINYMAYKITTVRLTFYCFLVFLILVFIYRNFHLLKKRKIHMWIATIMYPVAATLTILGSIFYRKFPALVVLDLITNNRFGFNNIAFSRYPITFLGTEIVTDAGGLDTNWHNTYFYIDSGYIRILLGNGVIIFILLIFLYTAISRYAVRNENYKIFIWCIMVCVFSIVNNVYINTILNPLLLIAPIALLDEVNSRKIKKLGIKNQGVKV